MSNLIILHGWQSSKEKWEKVKNVLQKQQQVIVPDLPGFKKETRLKQIWDLDDFVKWFEKFSLNKGKFFLLGHSFGGRIAIKFAIKHPDKIKALILVDSAGIIPDIKHKKITKFIIYAQKISFLPFYNFFRKMFYKYILKTTDYVEAEKVPYLAETFKNVIAQDLTKYFSEIKVPVFIVWGDKDKLTPVSDAYIMNKKIKNSKIQIFKNIGHSPHIEIPKILATKIQKYIYGIKN
ncbi:MAG: alpha/beta hydrolase [Patescibacteria group bacterium]|nr:alpha/beta hydrolase [Patescibacteria group bacterium]